MTFHVSNYAEGTGPLRMIDVAELLDQDPPPVRWQVEGVVARGLLSMTAGREKAGKSMLALAWAAAMANGGGDVAGITCHAARVLIVDGENSKPEIHRRLHAIGLRKAHAVDLMIAEARGFDLLAHMDDLEQLLDSEKPDVCVLDSFRSLWTGKEVEAGETALALDPLRQLLHDRDVGGLLLHHTRKDGTEYRGGTSIGASVENILLLSRESGDPERGRRKLANPACRYAAEQDDRWLLLSSGDTAINVTEAEAFEDVEHLPVTETLATPLLDLLKRKPEKPWTMADLARGVGRRPGDGSVRRALDVLASGQQIRRTERRQWELMPASFFSSNGHHQPEGGSL